MKWEEGEPVGAGVYYLAGYAVERGPKACIIKKPRSCDEYPERRFSDDCYEHDLPTLLRVTSLEAEPNASDSVSALWEIVAWFEG